MKYKKQIATSALAISLLVGGSSVFAATPRDLGIKNVQLTYHKQNKNNLKVKNKRNSNIVGTVETINNTGFTINTRNLKTKLASSVDVITSSSTQYKKDGVAATASELSVGQKVVVAGNFDKTTNILTAKTVKIATNKVPAGSKTKR